MNPLIPAPDTIPAAWGYFEFFSLFLLPIHLLFMNSVLGATAIAMYAHWRKTPVSGRVAYGLAKMLPLLLSLTINFGVAALLFVQVSYGQYLYTSSILMGAFWLSVIPLLIIAYYALYLYDFRFPRLGRRGLIVIALCLAIFLVIPFIFVNNMTLMLHPSLWHQYFKDSTGTILNLGDPTLWPRYLHFVLGAFAVGGLAVALFGRYLERRDLEAGRYAVETGMKVFAILTLLQVVDGLVFLLTLPIAVRNRLMGGDAVATAVFLSALIVALVVLLAAWQKRVTLAACTAVPLVYLMVALRDAVRTGYLLPGYHPSTLKVVPQNGPLVMFLVTLLIGLVVVAWLIQVFFRKTPAS
ncbi:MAG TPA: hypothetical protein VJ955_08180 [Desulfuromonadales bacterium]|nr:hypothetical protein [Desulfuromonadales bacterium]